MTPDPMPTRLRREAALWRGSKLAELLREAADQMEALLAEVARLKGERLAP